MRWRHLDDVVDGMEAADTPDLSCPGCGHDLAADDTYRSHRVCGACRRHFPLRTRERLNLIVDTGSFRETNAEPGAPAAGDERPLVLERVLDEGTRGVLGDAVVTGTATVGGTEVAVIVLDDHLVGAAISAIVAEKIILAFELALARSIPLVAVCAGGAAQTRSSPLALVQDARLAASAARLHHAGVPMVAVLTHPTAAAVFSAVASQCDLIVAEPGAHVGGESAPWSRDEISRHRQGAVETLLARGAIDAVVDRVKLRGYLATLLDLLHRRGALRADERATARRPPVAAREAVVAARHPERPDAAAYCHGLLEAFVEIHGDRAGHDDPTLIGGVGRLAGLTVAVIARRRGEAASDATGVAAARKAIRLARLAARLELPLVSLIESPVDDPAGRQLTPELSFAVAQLLGLLAVLPVPLVAVAVGEVRDSLAAALMVGDRALMQDHAVYSISTTEPVPTARIGAVVPAGEVGVRAVPALTAWECCRLGLVDVIVPEPEPAAHADPAWATATLRAEVTSALSELAGVGQRRLLDTRQRRLRALGQSTPAGLAAARRELHDLQEWQRSLRRSWEELRERWEHRSFARPHVTFQRPELGDLAQRLSTLRAESSRIRRSGAAERGPGRRSPVERAGDAGDVETPERRS
ncbi:MAG: hypothetical protein M3N47_04665 [Chloroflexota bacterium]|nr:hypothetical protein [Chloroflexota bacterium]